MPLSSGTRLGAYEIVSMIGAGGMGEVYRATDTNLGRDVAIKVLPEAFAQDMERLARFEREAKTLASLNHPNIAIVYGLEKAEGRALVMELIEGPTLADRIAQGPMAVDEALAIARQIADALEAAHEQGIVHRDLKPANVKVRENGTVKVLDFGLAKMLEPETLTSSNLSMSPTITSPAMTQIGMILGTAAYMSPEQATGKQVDKRADIWAFGVVMWEMLTGERLFEGETVSHTLAFVLTKEPDWGRLPAAVPPSIRRVLRRCLEKAARRRLADIADARFDLEEAAEPARESGGSVTEELQNRRPVSMLRTRRDLTLGVLAGIVLSAAAGFAWFALRPPPATRQIQFAVSPNVGQSVQISNFDRDLVISPDGTRIFYVGIGEGGRRQLMVRALDQLNAVPIHEISSASIAVSLFVSPDSRWVGFFEGDELKKVPVTGGPAIPLCKFEGNPRGASWGPDDSIVFATGIGGLRRVRAAGGDPQLLTRPDSQAGEISHLFPSLLPDGRFALFVVAGSEPNRSRVAIVDLKSGKYSVVLPAGGPAKYVLPGYIVFTSAGALLAAKFDTSRGQISGVPVPVIDHVMTVPSAAANYDVSSNGTLVFIPGGANQTAKRSLVWVDRLGREDPLNVPSRAYVHPRVSPDAKRIAVDIRDEQEDIFVWDLSRQTLTRLTIDPRLDEHPVWTPDGRRIVFNSLRSGAPNLYWQSADGTGSAEQLTSIDVAQDRQVRPPRTISSVAPDGTLLLDGPGGGRPNRTLIAVMPLSADTAVTPGSNRRIEPLVEGPVNTRNAEVSPDGRWLAYQSSESNQPQIYVRPFPNVSAGQWQVSTSGGIKPVWAPNGRELFFIDASDALMSVSIEPSGATLVHGNPVNLFDAARYLVRSGFTGRTYDVSPDGQRFLMVKDVGDANAASPSGPTITVVTNWLEDVKGRAAIK